MIYKIHIYKNNSWINSTQNKAKFVTEVCY